MNEPLNYADNPFPSDHCTTDPLPGDVRRVKICAGTGGNPDVSTFLVRHRWRPGFPGRPDTTDAFGAQQHWGKGLLLVPYLLDWGDCIGKIERERAHVTIMHSFPHPRDRALALFTVSYWSRVNDDCTTPFQRTLITAEPFAGYRWVPQALEKWWHEMTDPGNCKPDPPALAPAAAYQAALTWIARARPYWESLTREPWPYTPLDLLAYYQAGYVAPELPTSP